MNSNKKKNITYHNISKATKLGIGTISRYFNNGSVSEKSREKIEEFITKNNYQPNLGAKLIKGNDDCIYLIVCSIHESAILDIVNSIIVFFKSINTNVYVVTSSYDYKEYLDVLKQTINRKPKSLILLSPIMNDELRDYINNIKIDTYIFGDNSTNKPSIIIDEEKIMFNLTNKVIKNNEYQKIIYIGKTKNDITTGFLRHKGFRKSIKNKNVAFEEYFIENNSFDFIKNFIKDIDLRKLNEKIIIICGTHTIFKCLFYEKMNNNYKYSLTDIGYSSEFDYLEKSYRYKLFIDFHHIGYMLFKSIQLDEENKNNVINNFLIVEKNN